MTNKTSKVTLARYPEEVITHGFYTKVGKQIAIHLLDGKIITGKLTCIGQYEIFINIINKSDKEQEITVFKSAIKYIV